MDAVLYELALIRRDDLIREAARRRLAAQQPQRLAGRRL